jgi:signal transduction histidine kinase
MDTPGCIEIVAQAHHDADGRRFVQVEFGDDGRGMTPEIAARALDPYLTTRMGRGGTGLGQATVHALITSLGGRLAIESAPEQGTRVRFTLPML